MKLLPCVAFCTLTTLSIPTSTLAGVVIKTSNEASPISARPGESIEIPLSIANTADDATPPILAATAGFRLATAGGGVANDMEIVGVRGAADPFLPGPPLSMVVDNTFVVSVGPAALPAPLMASEEAELVIIQLDVAHGATGEYYLLLSPFEMTNPASSSYLALDLMPVTLPFMNQPDSRFGQDAVLAVVNVVVPEPGTVLLMVGGALLAGHRRWQVAGRPNKS